MSRSPAWWRSPALVGAPSASAQGWQGFVTIGAGSQYDCRPSVAGPEGREYHVEYSGAVLHTIGTPRLAVGAQGDFCTSNGYLGGRGGPIAEFKLLSPDRALRPFAKGGYFVTASREQQVNLVQRLEIARDHAMTDLAMAGALRNGHVARFFVDIEPCEHATVLHASTAEAATANLSGQT